MIYHENDIDVLLEDIDHIIAHGNHLFQLYQYREYVEMCVKLTFMHLIYIGYKTNAVKRITYEPVHNATGHDLLLIIYISYVLPKLKGIVV